MRENRQAFTKRWALFCAGKQFTDRDFVYRNRMMQAGDYRGAVYERASVRFCSLFRMNLSGSRILKGGDFTGNGWKDCNFFGADFTGLTMEVESYAQCAAGNSSFRHVRMLEVHGKDCNYAGSRWEKVQMDRCVFERCSFRKAVLVKCVVERTRFRDCILEEAVLEEAELSNVVFENCLFRGLEPEHMKGCIFQGCAFEKC